MERKKYDIAVIGAGPGGYVAAIRAAQLGKSVVLIEKEFVGGCCLNVGCIPTKALIACAEALYQIRKASQFGITTGEVSFDYAKMKARKDSIVSKIRQSLGSLIQTNKIVICRGHAQFQSPREIKVTGQDSQYIEAESIIIATGSMPLDIPAFPCDHRRICNSTSILELTQLPKSLAIVGGGYIGCEFASLFAELGVKVTILEALPHILAAQGTQISQFMSRAFQSRGIEIRSSVQVRSIQSGEHAARLTLSDGELEAEMVLVAAGRKIYTQGLDLEKAGLELNAKGAIDTDDQMRTAVPGIYAIGDVTGKWMLAHVASHQGVVAGSNAAGQEMCMHYHSVPAVVFTHPEIATVGHTLEQAQSMGYQAAAASFPFLALGKAHAAGQTEGFAQVVYDKKTEQILGAQAIGHDASNLIGEMALAIQNELTLDSITETIHAHPTIAESWLEAAAVAKNLPLSIPLKART